MRIIKVGMHWFPEGGGGADRYFHGLVSELVRHDSSVIADAGYSEIVIQFGWLGAPLIIYALWLMWQEMAIRFRLGLRTSEVMLGGAFMIALIPACFVGNIITQFSILWLVFGAALDPKALRVFVAKLQLMRTTGRAPAKRSATVA